jgi:hypothetical protein
MANIIITPDDDGYKPDNPTFLVYNAESKELVHTSPKLLELNSEAVEGQGRPTFRPFGIAMDDKFLYIASNDKLGRFYKSDYMFIDLVDVPLFVNTHEMVAYDGVLYVANTANDTIGIYNLKEQHYTFFDVNTFVCSDTAPIPDHVGSHDAAHVNSLCYHEGSIYFCLHNLNKRSSQLGRLNINSLQAEIISESGYCAHGVQVLNGNLYSLSTGTGEVIEVDLNTKEVRAYKVADSNKTFLRGLDILGGAIVFGGSNTYSEDRTIYMNNCFVARFDTETKVSNVMLNIKDAYIISDMKVLQG